MKPIDFPEKNVVIAKDQPQYQPLPAQINEDGSVLTVWELSQAEIAHLQLYGRLYLKILTFGQPLQPVFLTVNKNEVLGVGEKSHKNPNESQKETQTESQKKGLGFSDSLHSAISDICELFPIRKETLYMVIDKIQKQNEFLPDDAVFLAKSSLIIDNTYVGCSYEQFCNMLINYGQFHNPK